MVEPTTTQATTTTTTRTPDAYIFFCKVRQDSEQTGKTSADGPAIAILQRLQAFADASPEVAQLERLQAKAGGDEQGLLQRKTAEEEPLLQGKFPTAQRKSPEEEKALQGRFRTAQRKTPEDEPLPQGQFTASGGSISQRQPPSDAAPAAPNRTGLPDGLKSGIKELSGLAMDHVRLLYILAKPAQLNAHAYAKRSVIHVAPGQEEHLPHEAWHLMQQAQGRVQPYPPTSRRVCGQRWPRPGERVRSDGRAGSRQQPLNRVGLILTS